MWTDFSFTGSVVIFAQHTRERLNPPILLPPFGTWPFTPWAGSNKKFLALANWDFSLYGAFTVSALISRFILFQQAPLVQGEVLVLAVVKTELTSSLGGFPAPLISNVWPEVKVEKRTSFKAESIFLRVWFFDVVFSSLLWLFPQSSVQSGLIISVSWRSTDTIFLGGELIVPDCSTLSLAWKIKP